jgi:apolipoprotein D and lipocalin family protein
MKYFLLIIMIFIFNVSLIQSATPSVETADRVDLNQYLGNWYEFAAMPQYFERKCTGNTTAQYNLTDGELISVVNSCDTSNGKRSVANGRAVVVDKDSNSKLKVTFFHFLGWQFLLGGDYWILGIGENYSYAVVGAPSRKYAWILSRAPSMTEEQINEAKAVLVNQGFDTCKLITTIQDSGLQARTPLCKL